MKIWLKANRLDYAWLAEKCYVTESTVRNWMAQKKIPQAKVDLIYQMMRSKPMALPSAQESEEEEILLKLKVDPETLDKLAQQAFSSGRTLVEYLKDEMIKLTLREK